MLAYLSFIVTLLLVPFYLYLGLIAIAALSRRGGRAETGRGRPARFLFVIPAHDEEADIASTVASCRAVSYDPALYRVVVIADNCSDATARVARGAGAEVIERTDPARKSKGYALEAFFDRRPGLAGECDAVVLIDADTVVDPEILSAFSAELAAGKDWLQCYYTVRNPDSSWRTKMMTYAFSLFNGIWPLGQDRLGLSVGLKGNGMCFSTGGLARFPWKAYGLTEDLEFSWLLRLAGERIHFLETVRVSGSMPSRDGEGSVVQRSRWEAGRKALRGRFLGPLLRTSRLGTWSRLLYLIDLACPPLVTLLLGLIAAASVHLGILFDPHWLESWRWLLPVQGAMGLVLAFYALSPLFALGLPARYLLSLGALPYYVVWKFAAISARHPTAWIRTPREPVPSDAAG
jgi:cellulose synthase/poly-beta-1,6-N-acetylglucosamine synthase-like glycosyltransferase